MAYSPDAAFTTSPCVKGFSGGASFPGGAGSLGISKTDKGCDSRQTAVVFHAIGNDLAAAKILCSTDAAKRAHLALTECQAIVIPPVPTVVRAPEPVVPPPTVIVVPAVPVAEPHPVAASRPRYTYHTVGSCYLVGGKPTNVCYRILDDAALALEQNTSAKIVLTGPVESGKLVPYLQKKVSPSRIEIRLADEQNWTVNVQTEIEEPNE